jgi:acetylornithine deacetylase/succinyl-diaminopimelate desuccinylase-like protein
VNVVPGRCRLSLDIRAASDAERIAAVKDVMDGIQAICERRGIEFSVEQLVDAAAAPCSPRLMDQLGDAVQRAGLPRFDLLSGAGHDAMAMAAVTEVAMLFTRCGNGGISHNPLETMTADDADIAARVLLDFLRSYR